MKFKKNHFLLFAIFIIGVQQVLIAQITPWEAVAQMQKGINLGNTFEPPTEAGWNNPKAQEYYFDLYKDAGFDVVRIPVRWDNYTSKTFPYRVSVEYLNRIAEVVDWGLSRGLYIIINSHHDNWIKDNYEIASNRARFDSIWSQISVRFKGRSEKLFFEVLNEPHGLSKSQNDDMHQRIISIIRKTNPTRIVIFQGHNWGGSDELLQAAIPNDDYVMGSFHSYDPYEFGLLGEGLWGSESNINNLRNKFIGIKEWSDENNIPVFLGEFGSLRSCDYNSRMKHYKYYVQFSHEYGFSSCAWDDGGDFRIMERSSKIWHEVKDILIYCAPESPDNIKLEVFQDSVIKIDWKNIISRNDSIVIERRKSTNSNYSKIATLNNNATTYFDIKPDSGLTYHYRILAHFSDSTDIYSYPQRIYFPRWVVAEQEVFLAEPAIIPGTIEAENFDKGGEGVAYHDSDKNNSGGAYRTDEDVDIFEYEGKYFVFNVAPEEYYEYTVNVSQERTYDIDINIATTLPGGKFLLKIGEVESDTIETVSSESWVNPIKVSTRMKLNSGEQVMRLSILNTPLFNIDNMVFNVDTKSNLNLILENTITVLYPDRQNEFIVRYSDRNIRNFNLYNISGILIQSKPVQIEQNQIKFSNLKNGIYIVQAISETENYSRKVVIQ
ncbi:MAG: cellulase family glycosylhydrolase [Mariniphaga sp.]|nr:cellulase family glycosylhydrolase [Mariniphaga sp.]